MAMQRRLRGWKVEKRVLHLKRMTLGTTGQIGGMTCPGTDSVRRWSRRRRRDASHPNPNSRRAFASVPAGSWLCSWQEEKSAADNRRKSRHFPQARATEVERSTRPGTHVRPKTGCTEGLAAPAPSQSCPPRKLWFPGPCQHWETAWIWGALCSGHTVARRTNP